MARSRRFKKGTTVLVMVGVRNETAHRGRTLKEALDVAVQSRLPSGCSVKWSKMQKLATVAGGEGRISCPRDSRLDGETMRFIAMRKRRLNRSR